MSQQNTTSYIWQNRPLHDVFQFFHLGGVLKITFLRCLSCDQCGPNNVVTGLVDSSAALASDCLGSIPGRGPIFRAALTVVVSTNYLATHVFGC